jgi:hypothetical protein
MIESKKKFILVLAAVLLVFSIGVFLYYFKIFKKTQDTPIVKNETQNATFSAISLSNLRYDQANKAFKTKNEKLCLEIDDSNMRDLCINKVAQLRVEKKVCDAIEDKASKEKCAEMIVFNKIIRNGKINDCASLKIEDLQDRCYNEFMNSFFDVASCGFVPKKMFESCKNTIYHNSAFKKQDKKICGNIINNIELKADCEKIVQNAPKDSDGDGLDDELEKSLGLDPFKKDTNGNGVDDLDELQKKALVK